MIIGLNPSTADEKENDPIGSENDAWLNILAREAAIIVATWGNDGSYLNRSREILGTM